MATSKTARKLAHGQTEEQMEELRLQQIAGEVPMKKSKKSGYVFPANEAHLVHVEIHNPAYNAATGADEGIKRTQVFYPAEFKRMNDESAFAGQKVTVLHDPTGEAEDVNPADYLKPQMIGGKEAGAPLNPAAPKKEWQKLGLEKLIDIRETLLSDGKSKDLKEAALIADITKFLDASTDDVRLSTIQNLEALAEEAAKETK